MRKIKNLVYEWIITHSYLKKPFIFLLTIYITAFIAIFRSNFNYLDDLGRKHSGYHGWLDWSRWFTQAFSNIIHADWYLTDISPLPQLLACLLISVGGIFLLDIFRNGKSIDLWNVIAVSFVGLTPYFLGMISYKYDSPYMAFSFFVSIVPFLFYKKNEIAYMSISFICLILMCTSYQASSGIYPLLAFFLAMNDINAGRKMREIIRFILASAACYILALGSYWILLMRPNGTAVFSINSFVPSVFQKYIMFYTILYSDFKLIWKILVLLLLIVFIYSFTANSRKNKLAAFALSIIVLLVSSVLCFGIYLVIDQEKYDPRAMYGFGVFLAILAISISFSKITWWIKIVYVALFWCFFTFSFTYGNALSTQQGYLDYRIQLVAGDLNSMEIMNTKDIKEIQIKGDIGLSPVIENMSSGYHMLERLIPTEFCEGYWGEYYFLNYFNIPNVVPGDDEDDDFKELPLLKETMYHNIYGDKSKILIELK